MLVVVRESEKYVLDEEQMKEEVVGSISWKIPTSVKGANEMKTS